MVPYTSTFLIILPPPILYILIIKALTNPKPSVIIDSFAVNSLGIYILHQFVGKYTLMHYVPGYVSFYDEHYIIAPILLFFFMLIMAWSASALLHKTKIGRTLLGS